MENEINERIKELVGKWSGCDKQKIAKLINSLKQQFTNETSYEDDVVAVLRILKTIIEDSGDVVLGGAASVMLDKIIDTTKLK